MGVEDAMVAKDPVGNSLSRSILIFLELFEPDAEELLASEVVKLLMFLVNRGVFLVLDSNNSKKYFAKKCDS